ncbi:MAG: M48 family metalloprotease [Deltaproteobacteria bacterium]|nr:M48 family metalloprotease [Deltaproteobacteria bacterium]
MATGRAPSRGWASAVVAVLLLAACAPINVSQERELGLQFERQMRNELAFVYDRVIVDYVREMGEELVAQAGPQPFTYRFYVVYDDEINAFAGPAGHIYVHTETIQKARNASELAGVIAHEVGHVAERHIAENYNRSRNTQIGADVLTLGASILGGGMAGDAAALGTGLAAIGLLNSFGREAERESDVFAVRVMAGAGWDPNGLLTFFELLRHEEPRGGPTFLSSHPATADRIVATRAEIAMLDSVGGLRENDGGRFEIIQRRIDLVTGRYRLRRR